MIYRFMPSSRLFLGFVGMLLIAGSLRAQNPKAIYGTFALTGASIQTVTQGVVTGTVVIKDGRIAAVGAGVDVPADATVIDCRGKWIYPGMIDGGTTLGMSEVNSDPRTRDFNEVGDVIPQMRALTAVNPNSVLIPVTRVSGVTTVIAAPVGDLLPGTAALINLHGYTPDQMWAGFEGVVLIFPNTGRKGFMDRRTPDEIRKSADKAMEKLNDTWDLAVQYHRVDSAGGKPRYYPEMQALLPVVRGERPLMIEANTSKEILEAIKWATDRKIRKVILTGVSEGWRVAGAIVKAGYPVIAGPVLELPTRAYDRYDKPYANAGLMRSAGVVVALRTQQTENVRNLPYLAGFAAAYGMGREEALKAVTIVPAQIFGVADQLGSIEVGKRANLFVSDGDPFETKTNILHVFIGGWQIPMVSRQTLLYEEFLQRAPGAGK